MPFRTFQELPTRVAGDPLGPTYLGQLRRNQGYLRRAALLEHNADGEHNAIEVPRVVRRISKAAGNSVVTPSSTDIAAAACGTVGTFTLTLTSGRFTTQGMRIQITSINEDAKPYLFSYSITSATSIDIYVQKLSSTLSSAGNTWAASDDGFALAIYSDRLPETDWGNELVFFQREGGLTGEQAANVASWSAFVVDQAKIEACLDVEHVASTGAHDTRQVAAYYSLLQWDGAAYSYSGVGVTSITRTSAGVIEINYATLSNSTAFVCTDYARQTGSATEPFIGVAKASGNTRTIVKLYAWDAANAWWEPADGDFFFTVHG